MSLIAIDLDGTLLDPHGQLSQRAVAAVASASTAGHRIVIATGRPPELAVAATVDLAGHASHIVGANGTVITTFPSTPTGQPELLHVTGFAWAIAAELVTTLRHHDRQLGFALASDSGFVHERGFADRMPAAVHDDPIDDVLHREGDMAFKLLVFHEHHAVDRLLVDLPPLIEGLGDDFAVRHMGADAAEIGPANLDKCAGLHWLCDHLAVSAEQVVAIGDERNDLRMIDWAGHGVAVANADGAVLAAADEVVGANGDDGVADFLERFVATL